ncbi:hypothetical protein ACQ4PT_060823 [Festuca glaucescens]
MALDDCRQLCLGSCSCTAYAAANVSGGVSRGCVIWAVDLLDMRQYTVVVQDVYIRLPQSEDVLFVSQFLLYGDSECRWARRAPLATKTTSLPLRLRGEADSGDTEARPASSNAAGGKGLGSEEQRRGPFVDLKAPQL